MGVRDLDAYATGCPSCIRHSPRPCMEASHSSVGVAPGSKYLRTGAVEKSSLSLPGLYHELGHPKELVVVLSELT